jgi:hypothetical protein
LSQIQNPTLSLKSHGLYENNPIKKKIQKYNQFNKYKIKETNPENLSHNQLLQAFLGQHAASRDKYIQESN